MITSIKVFSFVLMSYCFVSLLGMSNDPSLHDREYKCFYGNAMSEVYPIMAKSQMEAEEKLIQLYPDQNYESFCRLKKEIR